MMHRWDMACQCLFRFDGIFTIHVVCWQFLKYIYCIIFVSENIYKVNLIKSPFPVYELNGEFRLRFTTAGVELLHNRKMSRIYLWRLDTIRRHIMVPNHHLFRLEAGRRCGRWSGKFDFISESYKEMNEKLDSIYKETLEKSKKEKKNLKCKWWYLKAVCFDANYI